MKSLVELMSIYHRHHTKEITKLTHFFGVPCIILSLQILLSWPHVGGVSLASLATLMLLTYYFFLDRPLAFVTSAILLPMLYFVQVIMQGKSIEFDFIVFFIFFMVGWMTQLIGHSFEGKKPAFMESFSQVFVAPIFLVAELCFVLGYRRDLQKKVEELASAQKTFAG